MGPPKKGTFYGGHNMTKYFRFTIELKAQVQNNPKGFGILENLERTRRLARKIAADEKALTEVCKVEFLNLLQGDGYGEEISSELNPLPEKELILSAAKGLESEDSEFFNMLFTESADNETEVEKDNILAFFYSHFGSPDIEAVNFECIEK
jgi:hypothetical protein